MTTSEFADVKKIELAKLTALETIVKVLEALKELDEDAHDWVLEKINE